MVRRNVFSFAEGHARMAFVTQLGLLKRAAWQGDGPGFVFRAK
jgi:hypothetical protein